MSHTFPSFVALLRNHAQNLSDKTAFTFLQDGETVAGMLSYAELDQRARAIAAKLQAQGVAGDRALLLYPPGLDFVAAFFGCLYAGCVAVPAYPPRANRSFERLQSIITDAEAQFALTTGELKEKLAGKLIRADSTEIQCVATDDESMGGVAGIANWVEAWNVTAPASNQLAFLQYTSGSTGTPKGVMVSHGNLIHNSELINEGFRHHDNGLSWLPPYHDMGLIGGVLQPLYVGSSMILMPPVSFLQRPLRWLQAVSKHRVITTGGPNFAFELCAKQITAEQKAGLDLSHWEVAFTGAEPVRSHTLDQFAEAFAECGFRREAFYPCYGMAETTLMVTGGHRDEQPILTTIDGQGLQERRADVPEEDSSEGLELVSSGRPLAQQAMRIVDPDQLMVLPEGRVGEIWVSGPSVAQGYWKREELTQQAFHAQPVNASAEDSAKSFLRTGDLGFVKNGELFVTGRLKDLIIIRGRNHYPQDIEETVVQSHPDLQVAASAAFAVDIDGEEQLVIVQEVKRSAVRKVNGEAVTQAIRQAVIQHHGLQPHAVLLLRTNSIPKTSSGKIQRYACRNGFLEDSLRVVAQWKAGEPVAGTHAATQQNAAQASTTSPTSAIPASARPNSTTVNPKPANPKQREIAAWLANRLGEIMGLNPQAIDHQEPMASFGLDSLRVVRLSAELEDLLELKLSPTLAYDFPTIASLSAYLAQQLDPSLQAGADAQEIAPQHSLAHEAIAIVGLGCRFPGADNPQEFWTLLLDGKDAIRSCDRWNNDGPEWGGFLNQVDQFDPQFFGLSPREAQRMDPQQRLLLEITWEALEQAGIPANQVAGTSTGVFVGLSSSDYSQLQSVQGVPVDAYSGTGNAHSVAANRLSYFLDLQGPSLAVDTACSSSLVAVHLACQSLNQGDCEMAIAGGVNLMLSPDLTQVFRQAGMMAEDGRCKTFDASADGYVRGEGGGVVLLKRLSVAQAAGDRILAVVQGSAINQDGRSNGLTAPNGRSQQAVIRQAMAQAGVNADAIDYVEAHGTGTSLGDPIELNALQTVFSTGSSRENVPVPTRWIGSVKTNIGHLEAAAGIAGLIKSVLSLQHHTIPPHLHLNQLNPHIQLDETLKIPTRAQTWEQGERPRLAGISSFGFGGTNAHVIVGEAPSVPEASEGATESLPHGDRSHHLLTLSAKTETALATMVQQYCDWLTQHPDATLSDVCFTANAGRTGFEQRLAAIAQSPAQLHEQLQGFLHRKRQRDVIRGKAQRNPGIAFLFTGQGAQSVGMGQQLYTAEPIFKEALDHCATLLKPLLKRDLIELLYGKSATELNETIYTQPALFAVEYALAQLWRSWGVQPTVVMGHSVGEYVAACLAGVFSLEDGLKLIATRAKLMQSLPENGSMVAVFAAASALPDLGESIAIAAYNGPELVVLSGEHQAIEQFLPQLKAKGIRYRKLNVSRAFHSPLMEPILAEFKQVAATVTYHQPQIPLISNLTGTLSTDAIATPDYWVRHIRQPVLFETSMRSLQERGDRIFLEIGPQPTLLSMGQQCLGKQSQKGKAATHTWLPSLYPGKDDLHQLLQSLGALAVQGIAVDWHAFYDNSSAQRIELPTYPFQRQRCWLEGLQKPSLRGAGSAATSFAAANAANTVASTSELNRIASPLSHYQRSWEAIEIAPAPIEPENWLVFVDERGVGEAVAAALEAQGHGVYRVHRGDRYQALGSNHWQLPAQHPEAFEQLLVAVTEQAPSPLQGIAYGWALDTPKLSVESTTEASVSTLMETQAETCGSVLHLLKAIKTRTPIWLLTQGTQTIQGETITGLAQSPLWGLGKVMALEHPETWGGLVDLSSATDAEPSSAEISTLVQLLQRPSGSDDQIALRQKKAYAAKLQVTAKASSGQNVAVRADANYLITGGLGALGLNIAQWLAEQGATQLVLVSRRSPNPEQQRTLDTLRKRGVTCDVRSLDITHRPAIVQLCRELRQGSTPLKGIIHAAGALADGLLLSQTWEQWETVLAPKLQGSWNLHQATQADSLDFFVMCSSVASMLGSPGQGNYAAANAFLDALAQARRAQGQIALSINWGPWAGSGMADQTKLNKGITAIAPEQYLAQLPQLLSESSAQVGLFDADWPFLLQQFPQLKTSGYFSEIAADLATETESPVQSVIREQLREAQSEQRPALVQEYLRGAIAHILQADPSSIAPTASLLDIGMDSLMIMEAVNQLKHDLQLMIYPREFYERPRIDALAKYLAVEFEQNQGLAVVDGNGSLSSTSGSNTSGANTSGSNGISSNGQANHTNGSGPLIVSSSPGKISPGKTPVVPRRVEKKAGPMAFILSSPRSGSTLLRVMLAGNPALFSPPELHLLPFEDLGDRKQQLGVSQLGEGLQRALMDLKGIDAEASRALIQALEARNAPIEEVYSLLQELAGNRRLIDKSPSYASNPENLARAERCIEGAKYIHLVRHPYAVLESFCRMRMDKLVGNGQQSPLDLAEDIWRASNQNTIEFTKQLSSEQHHLVCYEDLVREPERVLRSLCAFLEVPFAAAMLNPYEGDRMTDGVHAQSMSLGDPNFGSRKTVDSSMAEAWRKIELPRLLRHETQAIAQQLSYQLPREVDQIAVDQTERQRESFAATMTEKFLSVRGSTICLCTWGPESGPLVLCLHGILEQGASWLEVATELASKGYRIVAPDLRGHGRSAHGEGSGSYSVIDFLADLDGIVEQITDKPFTLVGHSLGSVVGAMFASVRPEWIRKLIMVETILPSEVNDDDTVSQLMAHLNTLSRPPEHPVFADVETAAERLRVATPALSRPLAMILAKRITEPCEGGVRWRWAPLLRTRAGIAFSGLTKSRYLGLLRRIRNPITLIYGDRSQFNRQADLQAQQQALAHATRIVVPGGHNLPIDAPSAIADAIVSP